METAATTNILKDIASPDVIMIEVLIYWIASFLIILLIDWYAAKKIGNKRRPGYQILKGPKMLAILIVSMFTAVIGVLCLVKGFSCTRGTLTYFGMPYLIGCLYFLVKVLRRVKAETQGRGFV